MSSFLAWLVLLFPVTVTFSADQVTITVTPVNTAPVVDAGMDETVPIETGWTSTATVTDDGLPSPPGKVTVLWTKISGPGEVTFADPAAINTTATFSVPGVYVLELVATDMEPVSRPPYRPPPKSE